MSAVFGRVELSGKPVDEARFLPRFEQLRRYGPDLSESWIEGANAVGRHLLRIAPAARNERLEGPIDGVLVVADAILDNRAELESALGLSRERASSASDTELIRLSFVRWGENCVDRLVGDFAFAAIQPAKHEVFLARDHIGSRPLFWALRGDTLIFSTAIESIVAHDEWRWRINDKAVAEYLLCPFFPVSSPFFRDVYSVPAGSLVTVRAGRASVDRWWRPSTKAVHRFKSQADVVAAGRTLLDNAIISRINTDGRIGAHCSGGIDSTGVTTIASRALRQSGRALTRAYAWSPSISEQYPADDAWDERGPLQALAQSEGVSLAFGHADGANFLEFLQRPIELEGDANLADEIPVLQSAQQDDLRVMLSGWGGDESFSSLGRGYFASLVFAGRINAAKRFAQASQRSLRRLDVLLPLLWRQVLYPLLPNPLYRFLSPDKSYVRNGSFISRRLRSRHAHLPAPRSAIKFGVDPNNNLYRHITAGHVTMRMETWAAWSSHHGFQYRYPLTDRRLLEFIFTLPPDLLYLNSQPRGLARAVLADCIPPSASKHDVANQRLRRDTRNAVWTAIAKEASGGGFNDDCPWIDRNAFLAHAASPLDQSRTENIIVFGEVFPAVQIWHLYRRAIRNGWL